jgi:hypothetical protein
MKKLDKEESKKISPPASNRTWIACPWELTVDWAYENLRRLHSRWELLEDRDRESTVKAILYALDRYNNPKLMEANHCPRSRTWLDSGVTESLRGGTTPPPEYWRPR